MISNHFHDWCIGITLGGILSFVVATILLNLNYTTEISGAIIFIIGIVISTLTATKNIDEDDDNN